MRKIHYFCRAFAKWMLKLKRRTKLWQHLSDQSRFLPVKRQSASSRWLMLLKRILTPRIAVSPGRKREGYLRKPSSDSMAFLLDSCTVKVLSRELFSSCKPFHCGDTDLDEFFAQDAVPNHEALLGKSYCFVLDADPATIVCAFTLSTHVKRKSTPASHIQNRSAVTRPF